MELLFGLFWFCLGGLCGFVLAGLMVAARDHQNEGNAGLQPRDYCDED